SGAEIRLLLAAHHYRAAWPYEDSELHDATSRHERYVAAARSERALDAGAAAALERRFLEHIDNDLDTPGALRVLDDIAEDITGGGAAPSGEGAVAAGSLLTSLLAVL